MTGEDGGVLPYINPCACKGDLEVVVNIQYTVQEELRGTQGKISLK